MTDIDRIIEVERDAAIDAQPFTLVEPFVYDKDSWHSDMANYICGDADADDYIRNELIKLFSSMPRGTYPASDRSKIINTQCLAMYMMNIGGQILENAIKNGMTLEKLGERTP